MDGLRRPDSCSHGRQSQVACRRVQKPMTRSCSEGAYNQRCAPISSNTLPYPHQEHITRVHSMETSMTTNCDLPVNGRSSPVSFADDEYHIPFNSPVGRLSLDVTVGRPRCFKARPRSLPRRYCRRQDVTSEEALTDSSSSSRASPEKEEDHLPSQRYCQEADERSEGTKTALSEPAAAGEAEYTPRAGRQHRDTETSSQVNNPSKRLGLRRQGCVELGPDPQTDPWVKLTQTPEKHTYHLKTMSDHNGNNEMNGTSLEATDSTPNSKAEESSGAKQGPPVAPKPAWVRQSLRSIKYGKSPAEAFKHSESRSQDAGRTFGVSLRATSSGGNQSIKQKISSFETFSNVDSPERTSRRPAPSTSISLTERSLGRVEKAQPEDPNNARKSRTAVFSAKDNDKPAQPDSSEPSGTSEKSSKVEQASSEKSEAIPQTPEPTVDERLSEPETSTSAPEEIPSTSEEKEEASPPQEDSPSNSEEKEEASQPEEGVPSNSEETEEASPLQEDLPSIGHSPRRSSSSKDPPSEKCSSSEGQASHSTSLRTRSLPLSTSSSADAYNQNGLEGAFLEIILSFSNQVSHALMRSMQSLPQSPCTRLGNPLNAPSGSPDPNPTEEEEMTPLSLAADSNEKGFSVSLAELRERTIERGECERDDSGPERPLTTPSAVCAQSVISALPPQEIQRMIQEVKDLDEDTLKQLEDIHVVILHKEEGAGLGFSIAGGIDLENKATTVHKVFPQGLAAQEGTIEKGDEVLSINGQTLKNVKHSDATAALRQARDLKQAVVVVCKSKEGGEGRGNNANDSSLSSGTEVSFTADEGGEALTLELEKNAGGVGFSLEGGKGSIHGDKPLVISRIFTGSTAEQKGLQVGDEVLQIQGSVLQGLARFEAWTIIKGLPEGPFTIVIRRKKEEQS
ncbi:pro-interleukin-16 isoform X2 [Hoplias malabaricus]|uniref:pro-interleukin-16 isoform X2 n=1 Tax=Hoplias malabaricus TaxID=27720 RepID=UPI0034631F7A